MSNDTPDKVNDELDEHRPVEEVPVEELPAAAGGQDHSEPEQGEGVADSQ